MPNLLHYWSGHQWIVYLWKIEEKQRKEAIRIGKKLNPISQAHVYLLNANDLKYVNNWRLFKSEFKEFFKLKVHQVKL